MQFGLSESQEFLKDSARKFFAGECPSAEMRRLMETDTAYDAALWSKLTDQGYTGHTVKQIFVSDNDGASWTKAGVPSPDGDGGTLAASPAGNVAIATESAASWLFYSPDGGTTWRIVNEQLDGGAGWADLGFTTDTDGVVVRGPAVNDGNTQQRPGQLFLTSDGGATWHQVAF